MVWRYTNSYADRYDGNIRIYVGSVDIRVYGYQRDITAPYCAEV